MKTRYFKNVASIKILPEKCTGCGMCMEVCPHDVFEISNKKASLADKDACMECGACAKNCPFGAVKVKSGVGCSAAVLNGWIKGTEPDCDCSGSGGSCC